MFSLSFVLALLPFCLAVYEKPANSAPFPKTVKNEIDISDKYIITLKPNVDLHKHVEFVQTLNVPRDGKEYAGVIHRYNVSDYQAYSGHFDRTVIEQLMSHDEVEDVEPDQIWTTLATIPDQNPPPTVDGPYMDGRGQDGQNHGPNLDGPQGHDEGLFGRTVTEQPCTYGLNLISHRGLSEEYKGYSYDSSAGHGTYGYIIDTGIDLQNPEFQGRAFNGHNVVRDTPFTDRFGHGTHVAGIVGSKSYGVAKRCTLIAVKVLDGFSGSMSDIQAGFDWAINDIVLFRRKHRAVINMSLGGPRSPSFNRLINSAYTQLGITTVVAAGNNDADATHFSPASAAGSIAIGATDRYRVRAPYSNWGQEITLFAPGTDILSCWTGNQTKVLSGTSMAAPFITGLSLYLQGFHWFLCARTLRWRLQLLATKKVVGDAKGSPNMFAYNSGGSRWILKANPYPPPAGPLHHWETDTEEKP